MDAAARGELPVPPWSPRPSMDAAARGELPVPPWSPRPDVFCFLTLTQADRNAELLLVFLKAGPLGARPAACNRFTQVAPDTESTHILLSLPPSPARSCPHTIVSSQSHVRRRFRRAARVSLAEITLAKPRLNSTMDCKRSSGSIASTERAKMREADRKTSMAK